MTTKVKNDKASDEILKEFIVNDKERIIRIEIQKSELIAKQDENQRQNSKHSTVEEKILEHLYK